MVQSTENRTVDNAQAMRESVSMELSRHR
jgi:hypothetical protein